jgi:tetratricopeptide (TPR) repeat protein
MPMIKTLLKTSLAIALSSCNFSADQLELERAKKAAEEKNYEQSYKHYRRLIDKDPKAPIALKATSEAVRVAHYELKNFREAVELYKNLVLYSESEQERTYAQARIAEIYFESLNDYRSAIVEYNRLLELPHSLQDEFTYKMAVAKSYFYLNNFFQAQTELAQLEKKFAEKNQVFEILFLRANIMLTSKDLDGAIKVLRELEMRDQEKFRQENLGLVLAKCYEEQKNLLAAVEVLQSMKAYYPRQEFIDRRIKSLKERAALQPGAKGLKK